jgi:hypothetical protein
VAVARDNAIVLPLAANALPGGWSANGDGTIDAGSSGVVSGSIRTPAAARYAIWVGGSFVGRISATVDAHEIGSARHELEWPGNFVDLGATRLAAGRHTVVVRYALGGWRPGTHGLAPFPFGPIVVAPTAEPRVISVAPAEAASLCGRTLDWVEAVG